MKRTPRRRSACRSCISEGTLSDISFASTKSTPLSTNESLFKKPELSSTQVTAALGGMQIQHLNHDKKFMLVDADDTIVYSYKEACFAEKTQRKEKVTAQAITGINGVKGRFRDTVKCKLATSCISSLFLLLIIMFLYYGISNFGKNVSEIRPLTEYFSKTFAQESAVPVDGTDKVIADNHGDNVMKSAIKSILVVNERLYKEVEFWRRQQLAFKTDLSKLKLLFNLMKPKDDVTVAMAKKKDSSSKEQSSSCCLCSCDELEMPDFALESSGGNIISTPQTETLQPDSWYYVLGLPVWRHTKSPRSIIQNSVAPGECWPFRGTIGSVVIQLAARITITAVSMEHISASMSLTGKVDSAPKTFSVFGLNSYNEEGVALGSFYYNISHSALQTFFINQQNEV
ncbi:nuclear migration and anchoring protein unc-84-like [Schistocerca serialis cubense]|uniref:nuclear migration and anchoring protein unc-84-like n=1 Tax=Schistocerca serialis cubense TaxID=2023355 RepID=UPI00214EFEBE|nr:nuclear migration and anchoring protein unc-84-like [Schistocerca serialis cubense]